MAGKWVQLHLQLPTQGMVAQVATDIHAICAVCGPRHARFWFDDYGRLVAQVGDGLCHHLIADLTTQPLDNFFARD